MSVPVRGSRRAHRLFYIEALAASTVKVAGKDVIASWKILISLGLAPLLYTLYAVLAAITARRAGLPWKVVVATPFLFTSAAPFIGYAALKFGEAGMDVFKWVFLPSFSFREPY